jgi:hypothetical protein
MMMGEIGTKERAAKKMVNKVMGRRFVSRFISDEPR